MNKEQVKSQLAVVASGRGGKGGNFQTRANPFGEREPVGGAPNCNAVPQFASAVDALLHSGCALILGHTRDGGAVVLTVLDGQNRHRTYCRTGEELEDACTSLLIAYGND